MVFAELSRTPARNSLIISLMRKENTPDHSQSSIRLLINESLVTVNDVEPTQTLLGFLRNQLRLTGTKEGCAEGDCGACTVVVGELSGSRLILKTINACIAWLPALDGMAIFTVEYLRGKTGELHPAQQAMVDCHGSQCGFCTPGFIMSLWQVYNDHVSQGTRADHSTLRQSLSGNLCRCTGYKPILEAGQKMFDLPEVRFDTSAIVEQLTALSNTSLGVYEFQGKCFHSPRSVAELTHLRSEQPRATLLAGCTDIGLWVNKQFRDIGNILYVGEVAGFNDIVINESSIRIGAAASLTDAYTALEEYYPEIAEMHERFASLPVRNAGTLGGNLANGSPIGDSMPWLIAVGASVLLVSADQERSLLLEDYYLGYMKTALRDDEVLVAIDIPKPRADQVFRTYKVSKRFDSDISAVCSAFSIRLNKDNIINDAVVAFGGMAAIPQRATASERALINRRWDEATMKSAQQALSDDYQPLSDMRASAQNRQQVAQNLLYRFFLETQAGLTSGELPLSVYEMNA